MSLAGKFELAARAVNMPQYEKEHRFHAVRKWRFDYAWPEVLVAVEIEGGTWSGGRHTTGTGYAKDCEKYNTAVLEGWAVIRLTEVQLRDSIGWAQAVLFLINSKQEEIS